MVSASGNAKPAAPPDNDDPLLLDEEDIDEILEIPNIQMLEPRNNQGNGLEQIIPACPHVMPQFQGAALRFNFPNPNDLLYINSYEELAHIETAVLCALYAIGPTVLQGDGITVYIQNSSFVAKVRQTAAPTAPPAPPTVREDDDLQNVNMSEVRESLNELDEEQRDSENEDSDGYTDEEPLDR